MKFTSKPVTVRCVASWMTMPNDMPNGNIECPECGQITVVISRYRDEEGNVKKQLTPHYRKDAT